MGIFSRGAFRADFGANATEGPRNTSGADIQACDCVEGSGQAASARGGPSARSNASSGARKARRAGRRSGECPDSALRARSGPCGGIGSPCHTGPTRGANSKGKGAHGANSANSAARRSVAKARLTRLTRSAARPDLKLPDAAGRARRRSDRNTNCAGRARRACRGPSG